jgi:hypothetical protein
MDSSELDDLRDEIETYDPDRVGHRDRLRLAQMLVRAAIGLAEEVAEATGDRHARAYWVDHAKVLAGADHGFLDRSFNLDEWMERLEGADE